MMENHIRHLVLDLIPKSSFFEPEDLPPPYPPAVDTRNNIQLNVFRAQLQSLHTGINGLRGADDEVATIFSQEILSLCSFSNSTRSLRNLDIAWDGCWPIMFHAFLFPNKWPSLERLRLEGIPTPDGELCAFIYKHSRTLRHLSIKRCTLGYRHPEDYLLGKSLGESVEKMLAGFRGGLRLTNFEILFGRINKHMYDDDWNALPTKVRPDLNWKATGQRLPQNAELLEAFILGLCPWQMKADRPIEYGRWDRRDEWNSLREEDESENWVECIDSYLI